MARFALGVFSLCAVVVAALLGWFYVEQRGQAPFHGSFIGGYVPDPKIEYSQWLTGQRERWARASVEVFGAGQRFELEQRELGIEVDLAAMLHQADRQRESGGLFVRFGRFLSAKTGGQELSWITRFDRERATDSLSVLAKRIDTPPVDAVVDLRRRRRIDARSGVELDVQATLDWLESHRGVEIAEVPLKIRELVPRVNAADLTPIDLNRVLSSFETDFRTRAGTRAINIRTAANALNGAIIEPGAVFSFNQVVGPRVESRGYREAPVIVDDELEPGVGGGVCQVATTVHAAAVLAGLDIVERRSHSRPSGYAPMGLDATVIDGQVDLRFRNPFSVPLLVSASFPDRFRLRIEIVGMSPRFHYEHKYSVAKRYDFYRRVLTKSVGVDGGFKRTQKGIPGYDVVSTITGKNDAGEERTFRYRSKYWPVPEVYWVAPGTDLAALPPLPEGASGIQRDGATVMGFIPKDVEERAAEPEVTIDGS
ncbi:MAG: VanW family protein [Polyangiaceae bacterium]